MSRILVFCFNLLMYTDVAVEKQNCTVYNEDGLMVRRFNNYRLVIPVLSEVM